MQICGQDATLQGQDTATAAQHSEHGHQWKRTTAFWINPWLDELLSVLVRTVSLGSKCKKKSVSKQIYLDILAPLTRELWPRLALSQSLPAICKNPAPSQSIYFIFNATSHECGFLASWSNTSELQTLVFEEHAKYSGSKRVSKQWTYDRGCVELKSASSEARINVFAGVKREKKNSIGELHCSCKMSKTTRQEKEALSTFALE